MLRSAQSAHVSSSNDVAVDETKDVVMTNAAKGDLRSQEAQDEFEQFAKKAGSKQKQKQKHAASDAMDSDDDEEETTTVLESEFQSVPKPNSVRSKKMAQSNGPPKAMGNDDNDDIDDLAMAIKSKKKKKSKKSKN
jgi:hypothetical protein